MTLSEDVSLKSCFYSFCGIIFISDIIKFSASNEKMLNGEMFITGYTKRSKYACVNLVCPILHLVILVWFCLL